MRIGTTPTHTFTLPADLASMAKKVRVVYSQLGTVALTKDVTELTDNSVVLTLTQEDTLKFHNKKPICIQLRVLTDGGDAMTSDIMTIDPYACLERCVFK